MAGLLTLVISFLARFIGLGKVSDKVKAIIQKIRGTVDKALDKAIEWIVGLVKKAGKFLVSKVKGGGDDKRTDVQKQADLDKGEAEAEKALNDPDLDADDVKKKLPSIKSKYKLTELTLVTDSQEEMTETDHIVAKVNPGKESPKKTKPKRMAKATVTFKCYKKYNLAAYKAQVKGQETGMKALTVQEFLDNRARYEKEGRSEEGSAEQERLRAKWRKKLTDEGKSKKEIDAVMDALAALHEPDQIAGGTPVCEELGDRRINSSIGSQWKSKIGTIQAAAEKVAAKMRKKWKMNVELKVERP
jgi:hypothetical protein